MSSIEPSSTTQTSDAAQVCARTLSIARATVSAELYAGMITLTVGWLYIALFVKLAIECSDPCDWSDRSDTYISDAMLPLQHAVVNRHSLRGHPACGEMQLHASPAHP